MTVILTALIITFLSPFAMFLGSASIEKGYRKRAFKRISSDPDLKVGTRLLRIEHEGRDKPLVGRCTIIEMKVGRMVIRCKDEDALMSFTGREFEKLHPVIKINKNVK